MASVTSISRKYVSNDELQNLSAFKAAIEKAPISRISLWESEKSGTSGAIINFKLDGKATKLSLLCTEKAIEHGIFRPTVEDDAYVCALGNVFAKNKGTNVESIIVY
jgi:hypothetical protein